MGKWLKKIASYAIVFLILFFLFRGLLSDWQGLERVEYNFRWLYFLISTLLFAFVIFIFSLVWRKIYLTLDRPGKISLFNTIKIYVYSQFGRYLPGKAWAYVGMVYLGEKEGLSRKHMAASVVYEIVLSVSASFVFPLMILGFQPGLLPQGLGYLPFVLVGLALLCLHPAIFYRLLALFLKIFKMGELSQEELLKPFDIFKIFFYFLAAMAVNGAAFYFFAGSFFDVAIHEFLNYSAFFSLANALGVVVILVPGGLGVREGFLSLFLKRYLTFSAGVFISLAARIWITLIEILIFLAVYFTANRKTLNNVAVTDI
jgi:glycosyltransferase 2 family protein